METPTGSGKKPDRIFVSSVLYITNLNITGRFQKRTNYLTDISGGIGIELAINRQAMMFRSAKNKSFKMSIFQM
ncbi:MAG: hypothetical protein HC905_02005 [Bacteroidales bacterium]|nr:hypothetical protein [Bacteroidales bacterium]